MIQTSDAGDVSNREVINKRVFNAPRERVFKAWTDPAQLVQWWGPKGFTNTFHKHDPRPGGVWNLTMHGPDGANYENTWVYVEINEPELIVLEHTTPPKFRLTATFEDQAGKTLLTFRMTFQSADECGKLKPICEPCNEQNLDRLEAVLGL